MKPTIGRIVTYKLTEADKDHLDKSYSREQKHANVSEELPAIVVAVWSEATINVQVIVDGNIAPLWKTSITKGDEPGNWNWPKREE